MKKAVLSLSVIVMYLMACQKTIGPNSNTPESINQPATSKNALTRLNEFKVMSFNMRNTDPADEFTQQDRKPYLLQVILDQDPDIIGVQEMAEDSIETWFRAQMAAAGYGIYSSGHAAGSPKTIWFKNDRFTLVRGGWFLMTLTETRSGKWAVLQDKQAPANSYFVINSHWTITSAAERLMDADSVLTAIKTNNTDNLPVICFGDFNGEPGTAEITKIKDASGLGMVDALFDNQGDPTFHHWDATGTKKLDYIMSTRNLGFLSSAVITTSFTVNGKTLWPSDHWPIVATYVPAVFGGARTDANGTSESTLTTFSFADINGDGKKDKVYWNRTYDGGNPRVFLSNGDGSFASAVPHSAGASTSATTWYYYADVNGDGKADEIVWDPTLNAGHTRVYLATADGNFSATAVDNTEGTSQGTTTLFNFADVNGDGKADKIYWNYTYDGGHARVYLATGNGSFSSTVVSGTGGASTTAGTSFYYADVNGDGKADEINWHSSVNSGHPNVYLSNGDGTFTASATFTNTGAYSTSDATQFSFADINGDGRADKVYWNYGNYLGEPKVYYSQATGFNGPIYSLRGTSQSANTIFYYTDINGDGQADQVRWNYGENSGQLKHYFAN